MSVSIQRSQSLQFHLSNMPLCRRAAVYPINLNEPHINLYTPKIIGANISLFYYGGFCYMMMRRCELQLSLLSLKLHSVVAAVPKKMDKSLAISFYFGFNHNSSHFLLLFGHTIASSVLDNTGW